MWALASVAALGLLVLTLAAFVPVTLVASGDLAANSAQVTAWERQPVPTRSTVTITATDGPLQVRPSLSHPEVMNPELVTSGQKPDETAAYRVAPSDPLVIEGLFGDLTVTTLKGTGTAARELDVQSLTTAAPVTLDSPAQQYSRTTSMLWRSLPTGLDPAPANPLRVSVANTDFEVSGSTVVPLSQMAWPAVRTVLSGLALLGGAAVTVLLAWLFGRALDPREDTDVGREFARAALGITLPMLVLNTMAYFLPVKVAAPALTLGIAVFVAVRWWRRPLRDIRESARGGLPILGLSLLAAMVLFFPMLLWGPTYVGEYKTDVFEYATLASIVRDHSMIEIQSLYPNGSAGTLTSGAGFSWRSIDSVFASGLSMLGLSTITAIALACVVLFLLFGAGLLVLRAMTGGGRWATLITFLTLLAPAFTGLFVEDYYSQYFLLAFVPALVVTAWLALDGAVDRPRWYLGYLGWCLAGVLAVMVAAYPYFFAVLVVGAAVGVLTSKGRLMAALRMAPVLVAQVLLLVNLALLTVINFAQTQQYQEGLNAIARNVLLSGFTVVDKVLLVVGFKPWLWRFGQYPAQDWMGFPGKQLWQVALTTTGSPLPALFVLATMGLVTLVAVRWRDSLRSFAFVASVSMLLVWVLFTAYFVREGGTYAAFKGAWTASVLVPLLFATARWRPRVAPVLTLVMAVVAAFWVRTVVADRTAWVITRSAAATATSHQSAQPDLDDLRALLGDAQTVAVIHGGQPLVGSDRDRVIEWQTWVLLRDAGIECTNCAFGSLETSVACESSATAPVPDLIISVGATGREEICGRSLVYDGQFIEVFE